jgi:AcrR family transcriptional regulator
LLTIFLQNPDEPVTFQSGKNDTVAGDVMRGCGLSGMKTATTKPKKETSGRVKHTLSQRENGSGNGSRPKRTRDRAAKKDALVVAALELFASKGYETTTTREIAASAGCAEGLIHRYFKGKAGLLAALIEHRLSKEVLDLGHTLRPAPSLEDEYVRMVDREVDRMWDSRDFLRVFIPRAIVDPSVGSVMSKVLISVRGKAILERLKHYESCLALPQDAMEILAQAVGMLGLVFGFVRPVLLGQDRLRAKKMATTVAKILVSSPVNSFAV